MAGEKFRVDQEPEEDRQVEQEGSQDLDQDAQGHILRQVRRPHNGLSRPH